MRKRTRTGISAYATIKSRFTTLMFIVVRVKTVIWANWSSSSSIPLFFFFPPLLVRSLPFFFLPSFLSFYVRFFFVVTSQFPPAPTPVSYCIHEAYYYLSNLTRILYLGLSFIISFYSRLIVLLAESPIAFIPD